MRRCAIVDLAAKLARGRTAKRSHTERLRRSGVEPRLRVIASAAAGYYDGCRAGPG